MVLNSSVERKENRALADREANSEPEQAGVEDHAVVLSVTSPSAAS